MVQFLTGVVEDRNDPDKLGRYRVRIIGNHNPDCDVLPVDKLPWATPLLGNTSAGISGVGASPTGLVEGSTVLLTYNDEDCQQPFIIGCVPGRPVKPGQKDSKRGFQDTKTGTYPHKPYLEETDLPRVSTNTKVEQTSVVDKKVSQVKDIEMPEGKKWSQPDNQYDTKYPYTNTYNSEGGHLIELDDTTGKERLNITHKSGTYTEMQPDGSIVNRIRGDRIDIVEKSGVVTIKGSASITIDGNSSVKIHNALNVEVSGKTTVNIMNDANLNVSGALNISVVDSLNIQASSINMESYFGDISIRAAGNIYNNAARNIHLLSAFNTNVDSEGGRVNLNCKLAEAPKMNALAIPPARKYPKLPAAATNGLV